MSLGKPSLLLPTHNRAPYIRAAIGSVLNQTRRDFELIVVDDGSSDDTLAVAREAARNDPRVRFLELEHQGVCAALNAGARVATGEYIGWIDSDDALAPIALERTAAVLDARPEVGLVYTRHEVMDASGTVLGLGERCLIPYSPERLLVDFMTFHFRLMRRTLFEQLGGVDESIPFAEDYDLCLRASEVTTIAHVPEPLYFYRVHEGALSRTHRAQQIAASREAVERALVRRGLGRELEVQSDASGRLTLQSRTPPVLDWSFFEAPAEVVDFDAGLVSCLCVTRGNYRHLERAIQCFAAQSYGHRELIVVYEALDEDAQRLLAHPPAGVEFIHVPLVPKQPLGALRNISLRAAHGAFICSWDDDDWYAPRRIELQLRALLHARAEACLLGRWVMFDELDRRAYVSGKRLWEGSLLCRRDLDGLSAGYPALERGEDTALVESLRKQHRVASLDRPELYIYTHHGENTWPTAHFRELLPAATELDEGDVARLCRKLADATAQPKRTTYSAPRAALAATALPAGEARLATDLIALQQQLAESEWWSADRLRETELKRLETLVRHAAREVPFYAAQLRAADIDPESELTEASWSRMPVLSRRDVESLGERLDAGEVPKSHGGLSFATSGGSSGVPVRVRKTSLTNLMWLAIQVREELWHRDKRPSCLARIRRVPSGLSDAQVALVRSPSGIVLPDWGPPANLFWTTGPLALMDDRVPIPEQAAFLRRLEPDYLFTFPANLRLLLAHFRDESAPLRSLRSVWTMSEVVDDSMRSLCRELFGCRIVHNYTSAEAGYMALQCPQSDVFHVQSEAVRVEVLDAQNHPCRPGQIGRVVITPLHNFATALLRYDTGDEAEVGGPCACGRGLPVLRRIVGRSYDYLVQAGGLRRRVDTGHYRLCKIPAIREFQIVQRAVDRIELLIVQSRPLSPDEAAEALAVLRAEFGPSFHLSISTVSEIARTEAGKLRTFICALPEGTREP